MVLCNRNFDAHDALEDVKALRRIFFASRLNFPTRDLLNYCKPIPFNEAYDDSLYLCKRNELTETFGSLLYDNSNGKSTISKCQIRQERACFRDGYIARDGYISKSQGKQKQRESCAISKLRIIRMNNELLSRWGIVTKQNANMRRCCCCIFEIQFDCLTCFIFVFLLRSLYN